MRILAIASAARGCRAAIVEDGKILAAFSIAPERGLPEAMSAAVAGLLAQAGPPGLVAVIVGPGSFTGLRAGLAIAHGIGLGAGVAVIGVTVAEALQAALPDLAGRLLWVASVSRAGRVFIGQDGEVGSHAIDALPAATGPIAVAGDAAAVVAAALAARGLNVMLTNATLPQPLHVAAVALRRLAGNLPPLAAVPLYVDAPEAKLPAGGLRKAPV